jgi:hypothetical protein
MPMGNWLPASKLPKNFAGKTVQTIVAPSGSSPLNAALDKQVGDLLLAGCKEGPNNYSYDAKIGGRYNGAFTYYALKTLKALKPDATYADWYRPSSRTFPRPATRRRRNSLAPRPHGRARP